MLVNQARIAQLVSALRAYDPERIILFGSHARGDADAHSDLDIAVIKETDERFWDRLGRAYDLLPSVGAVDVLVYTPAEFAEMQAQGNPFIEEIIAHGLLIYERGADETTLPRTIREQGTEYSAKRNRPAEAKRWLAQAQYELDVALHDAEGGFYAAACFYAQQATEKALKAYLYARGERRVLDHSVAELAQRCAQDSEPFRQILPRIKKLDRFYIQTRYPNGLPDGVPAESFDQKDADFALARATEALNVARVEIQALFKD